MPKINTTTILLLSEFVRPPDVFHAARHPVRRNLGQPLTHAHEFCEICWVEKGRISQLFNGKTLVMSPGDLMFIRPEDEHGFAADSDEEAKMINVAFDATVMRRMQSCYFGSNVGVGWNRSNAEALRRLGQAELRTLSAAFDELVSSPTDQLRLDCFILHCLSATLGQLRSGESCSVESSPEWLEEALRSFRALRDLPPGTEPFVKMAGRCPEHVNRAARRAYGKTATDLLNEIRLDRAARQLTATDDAIEDIAWRCGFRNLGHFYTLFRTRHGEPPRRFRLKSRRLTG